VLAELNSKTSTVVERIRDENAMGHGAGDLCRLQAYNKFAFVDVKERMCRSPKNLGE
jgi:hypothetical protein